MRSAPAAALGLALVPLSQAWNVELPPCLDNFKPFVSSGCFKDASDPTLIFRSGLDQHNMTVEKCVAECKGNGFRYAGLEYYGVCFCGSTVNGPQVPDAECSLPCSGNKSETCGGNKALSVWQDPTFAKGPEDVTVDDYKSLGCFTDDSSKGRTLSWPAKVNASAMTTKKCLAACEKGGFPFAGTEYGGECWCGVVLANDTAKVDESDCAMPCRGDGSVKCGGRARLSLYVAKDLESLEPCGRRPGTSSSSAEAVPTTETRPWYRLPTMSTSVMAKPSSSTSSKPAMTSGTAPQETSAKSPEATSGSPSSKSSASVKPGKSSTSTGQTSAPSESSATAPEQSGTKSGETTTPESSGTTTAGKTSTEAGPSESQKSMTDMPSKSSSSGAPGETQPSSSPSGSSTASAPETETTASGKPGESSETSKPGQSETKPSESGATAPVGTASTTSEMPTSAPSSSSGNTSMPSKPSETTSDNEAPSSSSDAGKPSSGTQSPGTTATSATQSVRTASSSKKGETGTSSTPGAGASSSKPGKSSSPTSTPTKSGGKSASTTTASLCTATSSVPTRCEWQRGNWCAPPLPDWNSRSGCAVAAKTCRLQVVSCFKYAGWPHTMDCFDFQRWCRNVERCCASSCRGRGRCSKGDCWSKFKPGFASPPATTTSVFPCASASATAPTSCPPAPTNICKQPANRRWGYGPGKPVGGIPLAVVGCNDVEDDWQSRPYKLYTEPDSGNSPSFRWPERPKVCADACREQYQHCRDTYVDSCRRLGWKVSLHRRRGVEPWAGKWAVEAKAGNADALCATTGDDYSWAAHRSDSTNCWGWGGNTPDLADRRCRAQYGDCLAANARVSPSSECKTWCRGAVH